MAGIVGILGGHARNDRLVRALSCISHNSNYKQIQIRNEHGCRIGAVYQEEQDLSYQKNPNCGVFGAIYGVALEKKTGWKKVDSQELIDNYLQGGIACVDQLDGFYSGLIIDQRIQTAYIFNDRSAAQSLFYSAGQNCLAFGPEGKAAIALRGLKPEADITGMMQFLNLGYPFGGRTLFKTVKRLKPASIIKYNLRDDSFEIVSYWDLRFSPKEFIHDTTAAIEAFEKSVEEAIGSVGTLDSSRLTIALTGGYDSRILLAELDSKKRLSCDAFTWGEKGDLPLSDPDIAKALANHYGIQHHFLAYNSSGVIRNAMDWTVVSEGLSDNFGYYAAGKNFLCDPIGLSRYVLTGDHIIGLGNIPKNIDEAIQNVTRLPSSGLIRPLETILRKNVAEALAAEQYDTIQKYIAQSANSHPMDVQDYLFFHIHCQGWLFSPGFFKEPMANVFRPLMLQPVIQLCQHLPYNLRTDKSIVVKYLWKRFPESMKFPICRAHSLIDWEYEIVKTENLSRFFKKYSQPERLEASPIGNYIDLDIYNDVYRDFFDSHPDPVSRKPSMVAGGLSIRRKVSQIPLLMAAYKTCESSLKNILPAWYFRKYPMRVYKLIARITILNLFLSAIDNDHFA